MRNRIVRAANGRRAACGKLGAPLGLLILPLLLVCGATLSRTAEARWGAHPLYSDGGALRWFTDLEEARAVAAREGKLIVVDVSVARCAACATAIGLMGEPSIRDRIASVAVGYHVDASRGTPWVRDFRANMRSASYLPFIGFFTPGRGWVAGFAPSRQTSRTELHGKLLAALDRAAVEHRRMQEHRGFDHVPPVPAPGVPTGGPSSAGTRPVKGASPVQKAGGRVPTHLTWYERIDEAEAVARAEGKVIFVTSTKPNCGMCKHLKNEVVPQVFGEMAKDCVFYVYDITRPENRTVDRLVRSNLPRARLMPLAGFMTPEHRWLHGFSGNTDARRLLGDLRTALRRR